MTNEAFRLLIDRINRGAGVAPRNVVFQPTMVLGESCGPVVAAS
jgi:LacI family transcriptional regulator